MDPNQSPRHVTLNSQDLMSYRYLEKFNQLLILDILRCSSMFSYSLKLGTLHSAIDS